MKAPFVIVLCIILISCKSDKEKAFERLAAEVNPLFAAIRPTVVRLFEIKGDDPAAIPKVIETCKSADELLGQLRSVRFDDEAVSADDRYPRVSTFAEELLDRRRFFCRPGNKDYPEELAECKKWCLETWEHLVSRVGDLQAAASKVGVEIVLLSPQTKKQAYEQLARELNPILTALKPTAALMLRDLRGRGKTSTVIEKLIATCSSDPALLKLQDVKFDIQYRRIAEYAQRLRNVPKRDCRAGSGDPEVMDECSGYCLSTWNYLEKEVDTLRWAANKEGVEIVSWFP